MITITPPNTYYGIQTIRYRHSGKYKYRGESVVIYKITANEYMVRVHPCAYGHTDNVKLIQVLVEWWPDHIPLKQTLHQGICRKTALIRAGVPVK